MEKKAFYVLEDFEPDLKTNTKGMNYVAKCPKCGKWNLYISKKTGLYNCFTGGCEFKGILQEFLPEKPLTDASTASGCFYPKRGKLRFVSSHAVQHPPLSSVVQSTELPSLSTERQVTIPADAPLRPGEEAFWNVFKKSWTF